MANTYSQIFIQIVFAVKYRQSLIHPSWETELYKYMTGIIQSKGQKLLSINGMPDHIHILIGMKVDCRLTDLVREVKKASTNFVKEQKFCPHKFQWQEGFGAFSYSRSHLSRVATYIENQKAHHLKGSFKQEFVKMLDAYEIEYGNEYLFDWIME